MFSRSSTPSRPTRPCPPVPPSETAVDSSPRASLRPSLKALDSFPPVPALPANIPCSAPLPEFCPVLISGLSSGYTDPRQVIVTLETCTASYKITLATLTSRASLLATFLQDLKPVAPALTLSAAPSHIMLSAPSPTASEDTASVYSRQSEVESSFTTIFSNHLRTADLLPPTPSTAVSSLDSPSTP